jgi:hypothetical protein
MLDYQTNEGGGQELEGWYVWKYPPSSTLKSCGVYDGEEIVIEELSGADLVISKGGNSDKELISFGGGDGGKRTLEEAEAEEVVSLLLSKDEESAIINAIDCISFDD